MRMKLYFPDCEWDWSFDIQGYIYDGEYTIRDSSERSLLEFSENRFGRYNEYRFRTTKKGILIVDPEELDQFGNEYPYGELRLS